MTPEECQIVKHQMRKCAAQELLKNPRISLCDVIVRILKNDEETRRDVYDGCS